MKKTAFILFFLIMAFSKTFVNGKPAGGATDTTGVMTAKIGNIEFKSKKVSVQKAGNVVIILGIADTQPFSAISIYVFNDSAKTGEIVFTADDNMKANCSYSSGNVAMRTAYGNINITNTDPLLTGTFSFTNVDSTKITNGTFSVPMK